MAMLIKILQGLKWFNNSNNPETYLDCYHKQSSLHLELFYHCTNINHSRIPRHSYPNHLHILNLPQI